MSEMRRLESLSLDDYHRPTQCAICGGLMVFRGVGEYECEDCKNRDYDDYGKVRLYVEAHRGATAIEVANATGVSQKAIRQMLRESRLEVTTGSRTFLQCEVCGCNIRSGRFCSKCEANVNRNIEDQVRKTKKVQGFGKQEQTDDGAKRFRREN